MKVQTKQSRPLSNALLAAAVALSPLYLFTSGGLQIAHGLFALLILWFVTTNRIRLKGAEWVLCILSLVIFGREWSVIVGGFGQGESLLEFFYIVFGFLVMLCIRRTLDFDGTAKAIGWGANMAVAVATIGLVMLGGFAGLKGTNYVRSIGTFNNPNQLAYFSVLCTSILSVLYLAGRSSTRTVLLTLPCLLFLALAALSKAGLLAEFVAAGALLWAVVARKFSREAATLGLVAVISVMVLLWYLGQFDGYLFAQRLAQIGADSDDNLANRGYFVWLDGSAKHFVFGLGQQGVSSSLGHEVHSTIFSMFGKYGAIGGVLFMSFIVVWLVATQRNFGWLGLTAIFIPPTFYGLTHNGARFTLFWVLIGMSMSMRRADRPVQWVAREVALSRTGQRSTLTDQLPN